MLFRSTMQVEPTKEQIAEMAARGWTWEEGWKAFHPSERVLIDSARVWLVRGGWGGNVAFFSDLEGPVSLEHAAGWAEDNLRRAALRSPIFSGLVEARWEPLTDAEVGTLLPSERALRLQVGTVSAGTTVVVWVNGHIKIYGNSGVVVTQSRAEVEAEIASRGLPPLPADAWEAE